MTESSNAIHLVIFDNDGVLVDSEVRDYEASRAVARQFGLDITRAEYATELMGREHSRLQVWISERLNVAPNPNVLVLYQQALDLRLNNVCCCDGARETLRKLSVPFVVATSRGRSEAVRLLSACGLAPYIDPRRVVSGDDVRQPKPSPEIFLRAAHLGGSQPRNCLVIEDSVAGIQAALAAKMQVVGMVGLLCPEDFADLGVPHISVLSELATYISDRSATRVT